MSNKKEMSFGAKLVFNIISDALVKYQSFLTGKVSIADVTEGLKEVLKETERVQALIDEAQNLDTDKKARDS